MCTGLPWPFRGSLLQPLPRVGTPFTGPSGVHPRKHKYLNVTSTIAKHTLPKPSTFYCSFRWQLIYIGWDTAMGAAASGDFTYLGWDVQCDSSYSRYIAEGTWTVERHVYTWPPGVDLLQGRNWRWRGRILIARVLKRDPCLWSRHSGKRRQDWV